MPVYLADRPNRLPTHPGEVLGEIIVPAMGLSKSAFARELKMSRQAVHNILTGKAPVTPLTAAKLGRFFGNSPQMWLNMQTAHDLWRVAHDHADELAEITPVS